MRILLVTTGLELGGAERQAVDLANRFSARGHEVAIAYLEGKVAVQPEESVRLYPLHFRKSVPGMIGGMVSLCRLIKNYRPDVVHSHMVHANLVTRVARIFTPMRRLVCTAHNTTEGGWPVTVAYRLTNRLADISTNVSHEAVEAFERSGAVPHGGMMAVLNGIDLTAFSNDPGLRAQSRSRLFPQNDARLLLAVGRLAEQKNHAGLLRAFAQIAQEFDDVVLWIAGDGPLRDMLLQLRRSLRLDEKVVFLGARDDIPDLMRAADAFVLSSRFEGFGLVVAEAMASGTPVVATDAGGVREVMNGTGILVPVDDGPALLHGLKEILSMSPDDRSAQARAAKQQVEEHLDIEHTVDAWLNIYHGEKP